MASLLPAVQIAARTGLALPLSPSYTSISLERLCCRLCRSSLVKAAATNQGRHSYNALDSRLPMSFSASSLAFISLWRFWADEIRARSSVVPPGEPHCFPVLASMPCHPRTVCVRRIFANTVPCVVTLRPFYPSDIAGRLLPFMSPRVAGAFFRHYSLMWYT